MIPSEKLEKAYEQLISTIDQDVAFMETFHKCSNDWDDNSKSDYFLNYYNEQNGYKQFLSNFKIARNLSGNESDKAKAIKLLCECVFPFSFKNVDDASELLRREGVSSDSKSGKILPVSLTSKTYMLFRPDVYFPLDKYAKATLKKLKFGSPKSYTEYADACKAFQQSVSKEVEEYTNKFFQDSAHSGLIDKLSKLPVFDVREAIRKRYTDKLLWVLGN
jgi:hypothetical protein